MSIADFNEWLVNNLKKEPHLAEGFLKEIIQKFNKDNNLETLLTSLKNVAKIQGWTELEKETGVSRRALYDALSETGNPRIKTFVTIVNSIGYDINLVEKVKVKIKD